MEGPERALADAERRMASIYALQGDREAPWRRVGSRPRHIAGNGLPGEAASERLVMRPSFSRWASIGESGAVARVARAERRAPSVSTFRRARSGLEGVAQAKGGVFDDGVATIEPGSRWRSSTS